MRINGEWQKVGPFRDVRISRLEAARNKSIRLYIADDAGDYIAEAIPGGALSLYVKKFPDDGFPSGLIGNSGSYDDEIIGDARKMKNAATK